MQLDNKVVLITGGTGFIGASLVNKLIDKDIDLNIISLPEDPYWRLKNKKFYKIFNIDLQDFSQVKNCIGELQPDIIFHLAAYVTPERDLQHLNKAFSINFEGTKNLLNSLDYDFDLFINTGTSEEYGQGKSPLREDVREHPVSPYSASKIASTKFCELMANVYKKSVITIRPFLVYGPTQISKSLIPSLIFSGLMKKELSLTPCEQSRDFIYIDDLINAYISLAENYEKVKNLGIFNIGSGTNIKIMRVVELIRDIIPDTKYLVGDKPYRIGENIEFYSSIEKIKETIDWSPQWKIQEGIAKTIEWWRGNKDIWIKYKHIWE